MKETNEAFAKRWLDQVIKIMMDNIKKEKWRWN
jgi:hypothetical protein